MKISLLKQIKSNCLIVCALLTAMNTTAQSLAVNTTGVTAHSSAILDVSSVNKGILIPRVSLTGINDVATIAAPATSLLVYNTNAAITGGSGLGYYFYNGTQWVKIMDTDTPATGWRLTGNAGTSAGTNFIGTTDNVGLVFKVNGFQSGIMDVSNLNTGFGERSLIANTTGTNNTAFGYRSLFSNTTGFDNTAMGYRSLYNNSTGYYNIAMGSDALLANTTGHENVAIGIKALTANTTGNGNTATGTFSLFSNSTGSSNTGFGDATLFTNTTGSDNTALGKHCALCKHNRAMEYSHWVKCPQW
ncbi:MAG: hypothetical protein IPG38_18015 [Chitinophagaceae bacterium]|nr:hypothetical protein [Chitinophagaceae bacterium]